MAPKHPVPKGYGSPCTEGEIITQGTGSRMGLNLEVDDGEWDPSQAMDERNCPRGDTHDLFCY